MRNAIKFLLILCISLHVSMVAADDIEFWADDVFDDGWYPGPGCPACRDPDDYPMDFAAFAYNGFFGDNPELVVDGVDWPFRVYNPQGEYVVIWFEGLLFDMPSLLPNLMEVKMRLQTGQVLTIEMLQDGPDLPVGEITQRDPDDDGVTSGGGGNEDDHDIDDYEPEEPERVGVVEIVDPDEDGNFPEDDYDYNDDYEEEEEYEEEA